MYKRLRDMREDKDLSQREIAARLGCSQRLYSNYERGEVRIPPDVLVELSRLYETSVDYLLDLTDEKEPYPKSEETEEERS
ncbi:MAG: helix-turn-helix transcriptional regulator [Clostridiales bacterium]|nr:helix-turn-helix transcriptional regulator [Clostridiales bacterium]